MENSHLGGWLWAKTKGKRKKKIKERNQGRIALGLRFNAYTRRLCSHFLWDQMTKTQTNRQSQ